MAPSTELGLNHFQPPPKIGCVGWGLEEPQEQRESLLLDLPSPKQCREREQESHLGPLQGIDHLQEAEKVDLEALKARDPALKELLEDDTFALATPAAMSAFELYRRSLIALDAGRELAQKAFRAVVQDNAEEPLKLLENSPKLPKLLPALTRSCAGFLKRRLCAGMRRMEVVNHFWKWPWSDRSIGLKQSSKR
ncbi:unnamed protein product [Durusdinium trenchii]|uniref:Uncharacterized protein n=1 Tax=Durusdinium trenchii TaxID=1381693 RepID=A0ABP0QA67_9DINO